MTAKQLARTTFSTSRLLDFASEKELTAQTGHEDGEWPLVIVKELVDNALDACEEAGIAPAITVDGRRRRDHRRATTAPACRPRRSRASSTSRSGSLARGLRLPDPRRPGNALKTIVAMPFVLSTASAGEVEIEARGERHLIDFAVDRIRQEPVIDHSGRAGRLEERDRDPVRWPDCSMLNPRRRQGPVFTNRRRLRWLNPHLTLTSTGSASTSTSTRPTRLGEMEAVRPDLAALVRRPSTSSG